MVLCIDAKIVRKKKVKNTIGKTKKQINEKNKKWGQENREYSKRHYQENIGLYWRRNLKRYNITPDDFNRMFIKQGGYCAICGEHQSEFKKRLHVHHDHGTGQVICLLCPKCNIGLGMFQDDPELLEKAAILVRQNQENSKTN